jgi:hypothetical protein
MQNPAENSKYKSAFKKAFCGARRRAKRKHLPFKITLDEMISQFMNQDGRCFYSGLELRIIKNNKDILHDPYKMTLDCRDPSFGYVKENIVWCIYCVNSFKQKMSKEELINICKNIVEYNE